MVDWLVRLLVVERVDSMAALMVVLRVVKWVVKLVDWLDL
jgi:hypothetical protein